MIFHPLLFYRSVHCYLWSGVATLASTSPTSNPNHIQYPFCLPVLYPHCMRCAEAMHNSCIVTNLNNLSSLACRNTSKRGESFGIGRIGSKIKGVFKSTTMEGAMLPSYGLVEGEDDMVSSVWPLGCSVEPGLVRIAHSGNEGFMVEVKLWKSW